MDLLYWVNGIEEPDQAYDNILAQRPDLLQTKIIEYPGEPQDDDWHDYWYDQLGMDGEGDILKWEEA